FKKANIAAKQVTDTARQLRIESVAWMAKKEWDKAIAVNKTIIEKWRPQAQTSYGYFSAVCYFEKGELDQAIEEVKKAASFYGWDHAFVYPHSFYLLGKIYEKKGDKQRAIENTEKFLDLWKDADPDLPDLIDAKARLAKLKGTSSK
ncbi:MAG: tetratricopeptide repeat protein, partial [bacterium]